jgi:CRP/FNR family transcriptional regulator
MLSNLDKVILLREVPFFQKMTLEQLRILASVCEEKHFPAGSSLFVFGDPGGTLYVVISGRVGIELEKRTGFIARIATLEALSCFGETEFFDSHNRINSAIALQDTHVLCLQREPLVALTRQYPELSLELISVLATRLREANERVAELTRGLPQELQDLYDSLADLSDPDIPDQQGT